MSIIQPNHLQKEGHQTESISPLKHLNPIKRMNRGFKKSHIFIEQTPAQNNKFKELLQTTKQLRFSHLSKNKDKDCLSDVKENHFLRNNKASQNNNNSLSKDKGNTYFRDIARKISYDNNKNGSKEKGLNFSDIIKKSKQKQHSQSLSRLQKPPVAKKAASTTQNIEKSFNKLKNKFFGSSIIVDKQNNKLTPNKGNSSFTLKQQNKVSCQVVDQNDKVRVSMEYLLSQINAQLSMDPHL